MDNEHQVCPWAVVDPLYLAYHNNEWGVPLHDDRKHFELLVLEGMQAGLSWLTILRKRENFRAAFDRFEPERVAAYDEARFMELMGNPGIVRNRSKIRAAISNARAFLQVQQEFGTFDRFIWSWVDGKPLINHWQTLAEIPAQTALSARISQDLAKRGFRFVGPTICYAYMQSAGLVWDHLAGCPCKPDCRKESI